MSIEAIARRRTREILRKGLHTEPISELMVAAYLIGLGDGIDACPARIDLEGWEDVVEPLRKIIKIVESREDGGEEKIDG